MSVERSSSREPGKREYDSLLATAASFFEAHDYDQVVLLVEEIPKHERSPAAQRLLRRASDLADEVADLKVRIDDMVAGGRFKHLKECLERLVEIRPGLKRYEGYLKAINTYRHGAAYKVHRAADGSVRFDPAGSEWTAGTIALLVLLPLLVFGGLYVAVRAYFADDAALTAVVLEIDDPTVEVAIDDRPLAADEIGVPVQMTVGEHDLAVRRGTEVIHTQRFRITEGNRTVLRILVKDDVPQAVAAAPVQAVPELPRREEQRIQPLPVLPPAAAPPQDDLRPKSAIPAQAPPPDPDVLDGIDLTPRGIQTVAEIPIQRNYDDLACSHDGRFVLGEMLDGPDVSSIHVRDGATLELKYEFPTPWRLAGSMVASPDGTAVFRWAVDRQDILSHDFKSSRSVNVVMPRRTGQTQRS